MVKKSKQLKMTLKPRLGKRPQKKSEMTRLGSALRALGGLGGSALGGVIGMGGAGGSFGSGLGAALSRWLGSGDYVVTSNSITQKASNGTVPSMHKEGQSIVVRHKEFLTEVRGSTSFLVRNEYDINPGLSTTFPWLSGIASQYSQYTIRGLVYHYIPTSGNAISGTNAALGTVMLQTSYRATEAAPTSKMEMLNEYWASESKPSEEFCHPIECNPKENPFNVQYVRTGTLPASENQLMYDLGRTTVAVSGQQATDVVLGDLWVTYEIELRKPVLTNVNNLDIQSFGSTSVSNINAGTPFGTDQVTRFSTMPALTTAGPNSITFGKGCVGTYQVTVCYQGCTSLVAPAWSITGTGSTILPVIGNTSIVASSYSVGTGNGILIGFVSIVDPEATTVLTSVMTGLAGVTRCRILVTEVNSLARVDT